jgi:ABC-2 type transport system permease protein
MRKEPTYVIAMTVLPLATIWFLSATIESLTADGERTATLEQLVPGMAITFAVMIVSNVGYNFFRESGWDTWSRLRASPASMGELAVGLSTGPALSIMLQQTVVFTVGVLLFGLEVRGSYLGLVAVCVAMVACLVAFGLALFAVCRTIVQIDLAVQASALVFAGLGGAIAPLDALPSWLRGLAPISPMYWAMRGYSCAVEGGSIGELNRAVLALLAFGAAFTTVAGLRLRRQVGGVRI